MAKEAHYHTRFDYDCFYHVYNRSIDLKPMFKSRDNYLFFLKRYNDFLPDVIDTYAYNLLGNHFHLCIRIKSKDEIEQYKIENNIPVDKNIHDIVSSRFRRLFQSYALAFNKQHNRVGTLFQKPFKRALVNNPKYLKNTIVYIHQNAQHHGLVKDFKDWEWSSYQTVLSDKATQLKRNELLQYYSKDEFINCHDTAVDDNVFLEIEL